MVKDRIARSVVTTRKSNYKPFRRPSRLTHLEIDRLPLHTPVCQGDEERELHLAKPAGELR